MNGELSILKSSEFCVERKVIDGFFSAYPEEHKRFIFFAKDKEAKNGTMLMVFNNIMSVATTEIEGYVIYSFTTFAGSYELMQKLKDAA